MKKEKVTFDQLTAGALLKFGKIDSVDMTLLMGGIHNIAEVVNDGPNYLNGYFILINGSVELNREYVNQFYQIDDRRVLESLQGNVVKKYLDGLNVLEFVLRKVKLFGEGCLVKEEIPKLFGEKQLSAINELYERGFIEDYIHEDTIYNNSYQAIRITQKGKLSLFLRDNHNEVATFLNFANIVGYEDLFINRFLLSQDLDKPVSEVLSMDAFSEFCRNYDEFLYIQDKNESGYTRERVNHK